MGNMVFYRMAPPNVNETESSSKGPATHWIDAWIMILLTLFRDQYFHLRRGNAKDHHWDKLTDSFNAEAGAQLTKQTLRNKIDNLKKKYKKERTEVVKTSGGTPSTWVWYEECDHMWATTPKCSGLPGSQDRGEVPYTGTNIDLDQYEPFDLNKDIPASPVHETPTNPETEGIDTTPSEVTAESSRQRACNLPNVEGKLNSKRNNTPSKPIADSLNRFVDVYKSLEETKMSIAEKHLALAAQMHSDNQAFQLRLHELDAKAKERAEDLKLELFRMKMEVSGSCKRKRQQEDDIFDV
jgi:hypothetical protein